MGCGDSHSSGSWCVLVQRINGQVDGWRKDGEQVAEEVQMGSVN